MPFSRVHHSQGKTAETKSTPSSKPSSSSSAVTKSTPSFTSTSGFDFKKIGILQPKLRLGQPTDADEQEADRIAEQVSRMQVSSKKFGSSETREKKPRGQLNISRKPSSTASNLRIKKDAAEQIEAIRSSSGFPLDSSIKESIESRFGGYDFSKVRIHTDWMAARSAQSVNALAYTIENHIVFGDGQYKPATLEGTRLLAHELTHVIQQQDKTNDIVQRKITAREDANDDEIEQLVIAISFEAKWKKFVELTDSMRQGMFMHTPAYLDLWSIGPVTDPLYDTNKRVALELADDIMAHLEQSSVDSYNYGAQFARILEFLGKKKEAARAMELYQAGWKFMSFMRRPEDTDIAVDLSPQEKIEIPEDVEGMPSLAASAPPKQTIEPSTVKAPVADAKNQNQEEEGAKETDSLEAERIPATERYVKDIRTSPLPFAGDLIVKLPNQIYLLADPNRPYLITGSIGKAITNGRVVNGQTNFVIVLDLEALSNNIEKYYVAPLVSKGVLSDSEARYSSSDFSTFIQRKSGQPPKIQAIFNRLDRTRNMQIIAVMLQDTDITPPGIATYFTSRKFMSAIRNEFAATPELAKAVFADADKLIGEGGAQDAADKLTALDESAFALISTEKKIEYLKVLTDAWTWGAHEKAIVEIFKSVSSIEELEKIKAHMKSQKLWDNTTMWDKMFSDLNHEYWSLLVAIGMKFSKTPYTLSEFKTLLWELIRNVTVVGVFINSNGEPEIIPEAMKQIEAAARGAIDFLESIWDSILMFVTQPDKIIEGVSQMIYLILNLQLAQIGYEPSVKYIDDIFSKISKQVVAAVRGLAIMGAEDIVIKKVKWALVWEVASWFIGVGEVKAALKGVQIGGMTEKLLSVSRILNKAAGLGKLTLNEAELVSRFERLAAILVKESKILKSEEEVMSLLSKLSNSELEKVVLAVQKSKVPDEASLMQLVKERPELEGLAKKLENMEKLASADRKVVMTEKEISNLQKIVAEERDPLFQKLLEKEEQIFNEKVRKPGSVVEVTKKELMETYDVEVKVGDHTYRRSIEDGTWCRFTTKKCNIMLDNSEVNRQRPKKDPSGTEPVGVEPRARGYAIEDAHLEKLRGNGWEGLPDWFPRIDGVRGGNVRRVSRAGKQAKVIEGADVLSIKSTWITDPAKLKDKIQEFLDLLKPNKYSNGEVFVKSIKSKNLHLVFEQGFLDKIDKEVIKALKEMERTAQKLRINFEWYVIPSNGQIIRGPDFFKAQKAMIDAL